ncbi:Armadillo repeat-containing protein 4 [Rhizophlyctis rosea]|uniref:Armadillo repeat-containing protein 4 n=1 Tax=Rhizophlyctis rosea TaxID=64517 RepID=A0AAD5SK94_9FUNG|nr:Armadillo repeat-containing protein 4 [Rhizophlyctis rosea]
MGASLSTRFEWSKAEQLRTSVTNQNLLHDLIRIIEQTCQTHPNESRAEFRRPLQWTTTLRPAAFTATGSGWNVVGGGGKQSKQVVTSTQTKSDGQPFFQLEHSSSTTSNPPPTPNSDTSIYTARVWSLDVLNKLLQLSDEHKPREMQEIIQANRDPINTIFGVTGEPGSALVDAFELFTNEADPRKREQYGKLYKLLLVLNSFDLQLLKSAVKETERDRSLDVHKVTEEFEMLHAFCGKDTKHALRSINWESDYIFANGYRAPPWRQVSGELGYLSVQPHDSDNLIVTATKKGYFINKGYVADENGAEHMNYEAESDVYPTLVELLKATSKHFAETVDKQEYLYQPEIPDKFVPTHEGPAGMATTHEQQHDAEESEDEGEYGDDTGTRGPKDKRNAMAKKRAKGASKQRAVEPSLKWRTLGSTLEDNPKLPNRGKKSASAGNPRSISASKEGKRGRTRHHVEQEEDSSSESGDSPEEEAQEKRQENTELPAEYYQIQKLVKYLRVGNQTATIIAICSLRDFDLMNEPNQLAIRDVGGLETLVNLLDTDDIKCKIGALKILKDISQNVQIRSAIADLDGMQPMVELLRDPDEELKCLTAETISHCAKNARNRRAVRRYGGIKKLVRLLKAKTGSKDERVAISGALALATCSKSSKNKEAIQSAGAIPLLANLLETNNEDLLIPVVGILQECASDEHYRVAIRSSGMIKFLVENLTRNNQELQTHCASAIFKCAEEDETRTLVRQYNGLPSLVNLLDNTGNKDLLTAATGAVWKCAQNLENVAAFNKLNVIKKLVGLMDNQPEDVLVNVVGALGACAQTVEGRQVLRESNGIAPMVGLLTGTNQALLVNVTTAVGACALDGDSMAVIDRLDGVRLLWSLLKSPNPQVQASAAWAISPCIEHAKDAGEMVRSFVGGLELIVSLLKSENVEVLASVCAAIANIAKDEENLAVITDHGVVPMLAKLTNTRSDKLRQHLAEAIARCCRWGNNRVAFGTAGAVAPLVKYLKSVDEEVHRATAKALHQLSMDPDNCITMHENGVVQLLLGMVGSSDPALQEAAAGTIGNIRRLALASEKASML